MERISKREVLLIVASATSASPAFILPSPSKSLRDFPEAPGKPSFKSAPLIPFIGSFFPSFLFLVPSGKGFLSICTQLELAEASMVQLSTT